jgi:enolase
MTEITNVDAWEVLDSRGNPTVRVAVEAGDAHGQFTVPAGASTGKHEALERRDGGDRYGGMGVREAVAAVESDLAPVAVGRDVTDQRGLDSALEAADGTDSLSNLGANAVLGVSGATLHAGSAVTDRPLYEHVRDVSDRPREGDDGASRLPLPMVNVISGGLHATGGIEIQDFLAVPVSANDYPEAVETVWDVRRAVRERIESEGHRPLVADEGGFAPPLDSIDDAFTLLEAGIREAGYDPGDDVGIAVDVAASHFYDADGETYRLDSVDRTLDRDGMVDLVASWVADYPLVSVEDPLHEDDWAGWERLRARVESVQVLGDDLLVTDRERLDRAIERDAATAVLVKPNQAGTISRALDVVERAREAGLGTVVSARSGETCDATIADLAVGLDAGQIKIGSLARSERLAKYNRMLGIDREGLGFAGDRDL